jgi:ATP-dependent Lon protease
MVSGYTREAGLRNLEREIAKVCRKVARAVAEGKTTPTRVTAAALEHFLGVPKITPEMALKANQVGVATGLAWTATGGDILFVEATTMPGKGKLILTGQLGDVMRESAQAALSYARSRARDFAIPDDYFANHDIHIHVPEGAIPKDGPSAGITMATAMLSAFIEQPVEKSLAMTGEITLRGNVLPIGGLKEKILAAKRAKIGAVVLPEGNRKHLEEIPKEVRKGLVFHFVSDVKEVFALALEGSTARDARRERARGGDPGRYAAL